MRRGLLLTAVAVIALVGAGGRPAGADGRVRETGDETFNQDVMQASGWVLVDFGGTWSPSCVKFAPILDEVAPLYDGKVKVLSLNTGTDARKMVNQGTCRRFDITDWPTLIMFQSGKVVARREGYCDSDHLQSWINGVLLAGGAGATAAPATAAAAAAEAGGLAWPKNVQGAWSAGNFLITLAGGGATFKNTQTGQVTGPLSLTGVVQDQYTLALPGQTAGGTITVVSPTSLTVQVPGVLDTATPATRVGPPPTVAITGGPGAPGAPGTTGATPGAAPAAMVDYHGHVPLGLVTESDGSSYGFPWHGPQVESFQGNMVADSFHTTVPVAAGVWDLAQFRLVGSGYNDPQTFTATFGLSPDSDAKTTFEITIIGNGREDKPLEDFQVSLDNPHQVQTALAGVFRLEIRATKVKGWGSAVLAEPKVNF